MNISKDGSKLFVVRGSNVVISFFALAYFANFLGAGELGTFFLFQASLRLLSIPADFGINEGIQKRISEGEHPSSVLTSGLLLKAPFLLVVGLAVYVFHPVIESYIGLEITLALVSGLVIYEYARGIEQALRGELRVGETATLQLGRQVTWASAGLVLVVAGFGARGLIISFLLGYVVMLVWGLYKLETPFGSVSVGRCRSIIHYAKYSFIGSVGGSFYSWMDVIVVGFFLSAAHVGAYEVAWRVASVLTLFSSSLAMTMFPQVSAWAAEDEREMIETTLPKVTTPAFVVATPAVFGAIVVGEEVLALPFGSEFAVASGVLVVFMGIKALQSVGEIYARTLRAIDRPDLIAHTRIVSAFLNVILNILLVWQFGIMGAAIATALSFMVFVGGTMYFLNLFIKVTVPKRHIGWTIVSSVVMMLSLGLITERVTIVSLPRLVAVIGLGGLVYLFVLSLYSPLRSDLLDFAREAVVGRQIQK